MPRAGSRATSQGRGNSHHGGRPIGKGDICLHRTPANLALDPALGMAHRRGRALKLRALGLHGPAQLVRVVPPLRGIGPHHQNAGLRRYRIGDRRPHSRRAERIDQRRQEPAYFPRLLHDGSPPQNRLRDHTRSDRSRPGGFRSCRRRLGRLLTGRSADLAFWHARLRPCIAPHLGGRTAIGSLMRQEPTTTERDSGVGILDEPRMSDRRLGAGADRF